MAGKRLAASRSSTNAGVTRRAGAGWANISEGYSPDSDGSVRAGLVSLARAERACGRGARLEHSGAVMASVDTSAAGGADRDLRDESPQRLLSTSADRFAVGRILTLGIPLVYLVTFGAFLFVTGDKDWDQMLTFQRVSLWGLALSGGSKQWNPVMAGGMSLAGEPQAGVLSLSMILSHLFAPVAALKLAALCFVAAGWAGTYVLARRHRFSPRSAALAASLFAGNGYMLARFATGHLKFDTALCLPLWLLGTLWSLRKEGETQGAAARRLLLLGLSFGALFALSCDGAPFSILLVVVWVGLDAVLLAAQRGSPRPLAFLALALAAGALLDAVYVFPMVENSFVFQRLRVAEAVDPLVFLFFLLVPTRGHPLPAPGMGHEFSVYIGPVLAYLLVRYRKPALAAVPSADRRRMLAISAVVLLLGLGSSHSLGRWAPPLPFDLLAPLPGFRTVDFPARFWGYLALPFALFGAVAIRELEAKEARPLLRHALSAGLVVSLVGYQAFSLSRPFLSARARVPVPEVTLPARIDRIANVLDPLGSQSATVLPTRGLIHAYADYDRGEIAPGAELVRSAVGPSGETVRAAARWNGWNDIELTLPGRPSPTRLVLNQNFHRFWSSSLGTVSRTEAGNLALGVPGSAAPTRVTLSFRDPGSALGQRVTRWSAGLEAAALLLLLLAGSRGGSLGRGERRWPTPDRP
jgi:hypothetical protein